MEIEVDVMKYTRAPPVHPIVIMAIMMDHQVYPVMLLVVQWLVD
jgi:hypothetical protein